MKKLLIIFALAAFSTTFAQANKNEKKETLTTKTTVTDSKGMNVSSKDITKTETQPVALSTSDANKTNQEMVLPPVYVHTDVSYNSDGTNYMFQEDKSGYRMMKGNDANAASAYGLLRATSQKGYYILSQNGDSSFGYFDQNGNFVVESYDDTNDSMKTTTYSIQMKDQKMTPIEKKMNDMDMEKDKM